MFGSPSASRKAAGAGVLGAAVGAVAFVLYLKTLYPGLGGGGDVAKFQYLGGVLGTPHAPGYPLYILISFVFAHLPVGTPAFRINVMSAACGAAAVGLVCAILVRLRCHLGVAAAAALALACDRFLWGKSTAAEVYALGAVLTALIVWLAVRWGETGRDRDLYLTAGVASLALGNHLTIAMLAPALVAYVFATRRQSIRPRSTAITALLIAVGVSQYGFILLRTWQHAAHLETHAANLRELWDVVTARTYADEIMAFTWRALLTSRVPQFWHMFLTEMNVAGALLLAIGVLVSWRRRLTAGLLLVLGALGVAWLTVNVDADVDGFILPAVVMMWLLAGLGLQAVWEWLSRRGSAGLVVGLAALVALPGWQLSRNYRANDHHRRTYEIGYMNALFASLGDRSAIVREAYSVDQQLLYKLVAEHAAGSRTIELIDAGRATIEHYAQAGYAVYAFVGSRDLLEGFGFRFTAVQLHEGGRPEGEPVDMAPLALFKLARWAPCAAIGNLGWVDLTKASSPGALTLKIDNYRPFDSVAVTYIGTTAAALAPELVASRGPRVPAFDVVVFELDRPADRTKLAALLARDAVPDPARILAQPRVARFEVRVNDDGQFSVSTIDLGGAAPAIAVTRATADLQNPQRVLVCGWSGGAIVAGGQSSEEIDLGPDGDSWFGQGWSAAESSAAGFVRRAVGPHAEWILPLERARHLRVRVRARVEGHPAAATRAVRLSINGAMLPYRTVTADWADYEWDISEGDARPGLNRMTIELDSSSAGALSVRAISVVIDASAPGGRRP